MSRTAYEETIFHIAKRQPVDLDVLESNLNVIEEIEEPIKQDEKTLFQSVSDLTDLSLYLEDLYHGNKDVAPHALLRKATNEISKRVKNYEDYVDYLKRKVPHVLDDILEDDEAPNKKVLEELQQLIQRIETLEEISG